MRARVCVPRRLCNFTHLEMMYHDRPDALGAAAGTSKHARDTNTPKANTDGRPPLLSPLLAARAPLTHTMALAVRALCGATLGRRSSRVGACV